MAQPKPLSDIRSDSSSESAISKPDEQVFAQVRSETWGARVQADTKSQRQDSDPETENGFLDMETGVITAAEKEGVSQLSGGEENGIDNTTSMPTEESSKMFAWFSDNFETLDLNHNGSLSREELGAHVLDPKFKGKEATYISTGYKTANDIERAAAELTSKGEEGTTRGITKEGFMALKERLSRFTSKDFRDKVSISSLVEDEYDWSKIDSNDDKTITRDEIAQAKKNEKTPPGRKEKIALIDAKFSDIAKSTDDTIPERYSGEDVYPAVNLAPKDNPDQEFVSLVDIEKQATNADRFLAELDGIIKYTDSRLTADNQGVNGSCFVLAPSYEMENRSPDKLKRIVKDNGDGTTTLTFNSRPDHPVTIQNPTEAELKTFASGPDSLHPRIEKGYAKLDAERRGISHKFEGKPASDGKEEHLPVPIQEALRKGGIPLTSMELLTGNKGESTARQLVEIENYLSKANDKNNLVIAASNQYADKDAGIMSGHAYTVTGFDADTGTVSLANPFKSKPSAEPRDANNKPLDGVADGRFKMNLKDFKNNFDYVTIAPLDD